MNTGVIQSITNVSQLLNEFKGLYIRIGFIFLLFPFGRSSIQGFLEKGGCVGLVDIAFFMIVDGLFCIVRFF